MTRDQEQSLRDMAQKYKWYHTIKLADGVYTDSYVPHFKRMWDFNLKCMDGVDFKNKRVLDIGCRDGLFSFEAEKRGANEIIGIDNELSRGASEFLIPLFKSKVKMYELNLYDLTPEKFGVFDIILFLGVLYHLRTPFLALKKITDCIPDGGGVLLLESGMLTSKILEKTELLYCPPPERSPYHDATSVTFFNKQGLCATLHAFNLELVDFKTLESADNLATADAGLMKIFLRKCEKLYRIFKRKLGLVIKNSVRIDIDRQFFIFVKLGKNDKLVDKKWKLTQNDIENYWFGTHKIHAKSNEVVRAKLNVKND